MERSIKIFVFVLIIISSPILVSAEKGKTAWWSTPIIIVLYIAFFLLAAAVALCLRHYRDRRLHHELYNNRRLAAAPGLGPEEIESLPSLRFSEMKMHKIDEKDQQLECSVCLNEFKDEEVLRILPHCLHVFHPQCISPWLSDHLTCPICRFVIINIMYTLSTLLYNVREIIFRRPFEFTLHDSNMWKFVGIYFYCYR